MEEDQQQETSYIKLKELENIYKPQNDDYQQDDTTKNLGDMKSEIEKQLDLEHKDLVKKQQNGQNADDFDERFDNLTEEAIQATSLLGGGDSDYSDEEDVENIDEENPQKNKTQKKKDIRKKQIKINSKYQSDISDQQKSLAKFQSLFLIASIQITLFFLDQLGLQIFNSDSKRAQYIFNSPIFSALYFLILLMYFLYMCSYIYENVYKTKDFKMEDKFLIFEQIFYILSIIALLGITYTYMWGDQIYKQFSTFYVIVNIIPFGIYKFSYQKYLIVKQDMDEKLWHLELLTTDDNLYSDDDDDLDKGSTNMFSYKDREKLDSQKLDYL